MTYMSTNVFQFTADNIRLDIIRKFKRRKYLIRISLILFKLSRIFSQLNQEIFYFVIDFCHALFTYSLYKKRNTKSICGSQKWYSCPSLYSRILINRIVDTIFDKCSAPLNPNHMDYRR